jgi:hypothetical protein
MRKTLEPQVRLASTRFRNRLRSEASHRTRQRFRPRAVAERALRRNPRPTGHPGVLPRGCARSVPKHRFRGTSAGIQNAPRPIEQSLSLLRRCSTAFRPRCLGYQPSALVLGTGVEPATARPKSGALPTELTEIGDDRFEPMSGTHGADPRSRSSRTREARAPLDSRHQRSKPSKRRRWESNPLKAALQAAAVPSGSDVDCVSTRQKMSSPGFEPGLRPSQGGHSSTVTA